MASLLDAFLADWTTRPQMETTWSTEVIRSNAGISESRRARASRPARVITVTWTPTTRGELARLLAMLANATDTELVLPLVQDAARVTSDSTGTTINASATNRRFAAGSLVVVHGRNDVANAQARTINTPGGSTITVTAGLTGTITEGGCAYPGVACRLLLAPARTALRTGTVGQVSAVFEEVRGSSALPAWVALDYTSDWSTAADPSGSGTYPILATEPEWTEYPEIGWTRDGDEVDWAQDRGIYALGARPRMEIRALCVGTTRAESLDILKLFDSRRGRLLPFWLISPVEQWNVESKSSTSIEITAEGDYADLTLYDAVGLVLKDGTRIVRPISSRVDSGSTWVLGWASAATFNLADIERAAPALFVRFADDTIQEEWLTVEIARVPLQVIEALNDADVSVTNIDERNAACACTSLNALLSPIAWYRADGDVDVDGSNKVSTWYDESTGGTADLGSISAAKAPTLVAAAQNGLPVIRSVTGEGVHRYTPGSHPFAVNGKASAYSITVVALIKTSQAAYYMNYGAYNNYMWERNISYPAPSYFASDTQDGGGYSTAYSTESADGTWKMVAGYWPSLNSRSIRVNGETKVTQGTTRVLTTHNVFSLFGIYGYPGQLGNYYAGAAVDLAEVVVFDRDLSSDDYDTLRDIWEAKWGVTLT